MTFTKCSHHHPIKTVKSTSSEPVGKIIFTFYQTRIDTVLGEVKELIRF